jgi:hypothetical protein
MGSSEFEVIHEEEIEGQSGPINLKIESNDEYKAAVVGKYMQKLARNYKVTPK